MKNLMYKCMAKGQSKLADMHRGAFAFEYIIVLALMVVVIVAAWNVLGAAVESKTNDIGSFITGINPK